MGDHFVLLVDRLLTESTLAATIESSRNKSQGEHTLASVVQDSPAFSPQKRNSGDGSSGEKLVECRICQDEDEDSNMEVPCSCCGSLKYAHRKCVQRWCNEKGDTMCEICLQQFKPGYTAPPKLFHYGAIPMNFRGNWGISRRDLHNPHFIAMVSTDRSFVDNDHDDYSASTPQSMSVIYCRSVALIFMVLLVLRHTLPIIVSADEYSFTVYMLLLMRIVGVLLPVYVILRALTVFPRRRQQQVTLESATSDSEYEAEPGMQLQPQPQPQPRLIQVL